MKSAKKIVFKIVLFLGIGLNAYGYDDSYYCSRPIPLGAGLGIGVYGSFHTVFFNVRDKETTIPIPGENSFRYLERYDTVQQAPGGGLFLSYGCTFCNRFVATIRADALALASSAEHAYVEQDDQQNTLHEVGLRGILDLSFQPGFLIGNCALAYFKAGGTIGWVKEKAWIKRSGPPYDVIDKKTKRHYPGGYVLGGGADFLLMKCFSLFMEYDWRSYISQLSSLGTVDSDIFTLDTRVTTLHTSSFSFGLILRF
ncbi:MAG: hypothetical protein WAM28_01005 [Chlamydiales bacterium]